MSEALELWEQPEADEMFMIAGWRQWADAGSISSSLPQYLIDRTEARQIGQINVDGFYLFQIPGTHHLVRPVVTFEDGYPTSLETQRNEIYFSGNDERGFILFLGDEPHQDIERYVETLLQAAEKLKVQRIIGLGGVYGEIPYDRERMLSAIYSLPDLKEEVEALAVNLSDYQGGASIGSYVCRRAGERQMEYVGFYAFVPTYDFTGVAEIGNTIRIENDFMAWLAAMRRIDYMLKMDFDFHDLEEKSDKLIHVVDKKVEELDRLAPQMGVREYMDRLVEGFEEMRFEPLDELWEEELRRLFDEDGG